MQTRTHDVWYGTGWYNQYMRNNIYRLISFNRSEKAKLNGITVVENVSIGEIKEEISSRVK